MACRASAGREPQVTLRYSSRASSSLPSFCSSVSAMRELGQRGLVRSRDTSRPAAARRRSPRPTSPRRRSAVHQQEDLGLRRVQRILGQELGEQLVGRRRTAWPRASRGHQVLGVDDLPLHVAPGLVGRVLGQVLAPGGQGLGELLLQLVGAAQQVAGVGDLLAVLVARVGQEPLQARRPRPRSGRGCM